ncbi:MAG: hypothetical protein HQ465_01755 [Rhodospirillales bacterium]|nr:hypothetical protein [Rhodospirillales bacterium]
MEAKFRGHRPYKSSEVELLLCTWPVVQETCVIAGGDFYRGDTVKALLVMRNSA